MANIRLSTQTDTSKRRPRASEPKCEWHLVCVTSKGKVSILRNLDLHTARETYKSLKPDEHPVKTEYCEICMEQNGGSFTMWGSSYSSASERLERIHIIGPEGEDLEPWFGVEPYSRFLCNQRHKRRREPKWDASRTDFWNNPKLWQGLDPTRQLCWMERSDARDHHEQHLDRDLPEHRGDSVERHFFGSADLRFTA